MILSREYVAGLFDGEGNIIIARCKSPGRRDQYALRVSIANTHKPVLEAIQTQYRGHLKPTNGGVKPCWVVVLSARQALVFLEEITPLLHIKRPQALVAIEFQTHVSVRRQLTQEVQDLREQYKQQVSALTRV